MKWHLGGSNKHRHQVELVSSTVRVQLIKSVARPVTDLKRESSVEAQAGRHIHLNMLTLDIFIVY